MRPNNNFQQQVARLATLRGKISFACHSQINSIINTFRYNSVFFNSFPDCSNALTCCAIFFEFALSLTRLTRLLVNHSSGVALSAKQNLSGLLNFGTFAISTYFIALVRNWFCNAFDSVKKVDFNVLKDVAGFELAIL